MGKINVLEQLDKKTITADGLAKQVIRNPKLLPDILNGVFSKSPRVKYGCAKILRTISQAKPESLYSKMNFFVELLDSDVRIIKWNAMDIIANLTKVDTKNKFDTIFKTFYNLLYDGDLITAGHVVDNSGQIAQAKLKFRDKITKELLKVEKVTLPTKECRNILAGKTISAFDAYFDQITDKDKDKVISFVKGQLTNRRNATKNKAAKFLAKNS